MVLVAGQHTTSMYATRHPTPGLPGSRRTKIGSNGLLVPGLTPSEPWVRACGTRTAHVMLNNCAYVLHLCKESPVPWVGGHCDLSADFNIPVMPDAVRPTTGVLFEPTY